VAAATVLALWVLSHLLTPSRTFTLSGERSEHIFDLEENNKISCPVMSL